MPKSVKLGDTRILQARNPELYDDLLGDIDLNNDRFRSQAFTDAMKDTRRGIFDTLQLFLDASRRLKRVEGDLKDGNGQGASNALTTLEDPSLRAKAVDIILAWSQSGQSPETIAVVVGNALRRTRPDEIDSQDKLLTCLASLNAGGAASNALTTLEDPSLRAKAVDIILACLLDPEGRNASANVHARNAIARLKPEEEELRTQLLDSLDN